MRRSTNFSSMLWIVSAIFVALIASTLVVQGEEAIAAPADLLKAGKCKHLWRHAKLVGRCFGFTPYKELVPSLKSVEVANAEECRAICCNLGDKCISWQFFHNPKDSNVKECKLTDKVVRLGLEATGTPDWCDPHPPSKWNGHRLTSRSSDGKCHWGEQLPSQCFGLGDERKIDGQSLNTTGCADACCKDPDCSMWQEVPGRGCYFNKADGIWCDKDPGIYDGGRKCIKDFCDGREAEILTQGSHA